MHGRVKRANLARIIALAAIVAQNEALAGLYHLEQGNVFRRLFERNAALGAPVGTEDVGLDQLGIDLAKTPKWLENTIQDCANFSAGFGDEITFGITWKLREWGGFNQVDPCSGLYKGGKWTGFGAGIFYGGPARFASHALRTVGRIKRSYYWLRGKKIRLIA